MWNKGGEEPGLDRHQLQRDAGVTRQEMPMKWLKYGAVAALSAGMMMTMSPVTASGAEEVVIKSVAEQVEDVADEVTEYATIVTTPSNQKVLQVPESQQSAGWERARQKRTAAVKKMADQGIVKLDTDDDGNQVLSVPWWNQKLQYKKLTLTQKLQGEVVAGAIGELAKDVLLHPIDTLKSRKQAGVSGNDEEEEGVDGEEMVQDVEKLSPKETLVGVGGSDSEERELVAPTFASAETDDTSYASPSGEGVFSSKGASTLDEEEDTSLLRKVRDLYAGFPAVATSSLPQGGVFFLCKKGGIEIIKALSPQFASSLLGQAIPVIPGSVGYWGVRTPSEIIKLKVQLGQSPSVKEAFVDVNKQIQEQGPLSLWKFYPSLLALDIPYAILNFSLYGVFNDYISGMGIEASVYTRLVSGAACGMIAAAITCPIDVAKTRIISRGKSSEVEGEAIDQNVLKEMAKIVSEEGPGALLTGITERTVYVGLSNAIRLAAYSTSRMDLMLRSFDNL